MTKRKLRVLLTGGGTGGHIYPALAFADRLATLYEHVEFLYVGTQRGIEQRIVPQKGYAFRAIQIEGLSREITIKGLAYNIQSAKLLLRSLRKVKHIMNAFKPDVVIGTGGYVSAPVIYMASRLHIPTLIHEQNSVVGVTNKCLAHFVDKIAICFEEAKDQFGSNYHKVVLTGNPRAQEVAEHARSGGLERLGVDVHKETALIFGGSQGAGAINDAFIEAYHLFADVDYQVVFVSGLGYYAHTIEQIERQSAKAANIHIFPYIDHMPDVLKEVDLVVGRSGATSLAEITALGLPSVLIPSPNVTADHQTLNAMSVVKNKAATLIPEPALSRDAFFHAVNKLMTNTSLRHTMSQRAKSLGRPKAADHLIELMLSVIENQ